MPAGKYSGFRIEIREPAIALLTFDEPARLNGMHVDTKRDFVEAVTQIQCSEDVRVLVVTGEGRAFCAGDDVTGGYWGDDESWSKAHTQRVRKERKDGLGSYSTLRAFSAAVNRALLDLDKLSIAAINGHAIQSGLSLALACDFRIASKSAKLGSATLRMGYMPDEGGHHLLVHHIGVAKTLDFLMKSRIVDAAEALALGLVNEVAEPERLLPRALELATQLSEGPQVAMRLLKRAIYNAANLTFAQACDDIASKTGISDHHPDTREGVTAFLQKRKPSFNQKK